MYNFLKDFVPLCKTMNDPTGRLMEPGGGPDFNPISTMGGRLCPPPILLLALHIFRHSTPRVKSNMVGIFCQNLGGGTNAPCPPHSAGPATR